MKNRFEKSNEHNNKSARIGVSILFFILIIGAFIFFMSALTTTKEDGSKDLLASTLERDITHCYAVEGQYPPSVDYLESRYGLTYDKHKYKVDYTLVGANIRPTFIILEKNE